MNRPYQTKFAESLMDISGLSTTTSNPRKCLRSSEILKSNTMVEKIMLVLRTQFINPFQPDLDKSELFNLEIVDTYKDNSIKGGERQARGVSERYVLTSPDMKVPYDFTSFLRNGENKQMLFNLVQKAVEEGRNQLFAKTAYFPNKSKCTKMSKDEVTVVTNLTRDHEEADTKLVALAHAANVPPGDTITIRSPSGDIDILLSSWRMILEALKC